MCSFCFLLSHAPQCTACRMNLSRRSGEAVSFNATDPPFFASFPTEVFYEPSAAPMTQVAVSAVASGAGLRDVPGMGRRIQDPGRICSLWNDHCKVSAFDTSTSRMLHSPSLASRVNVTCQSANYMDAVPTFLVRRG